MRKPCEPMFVCESRALPVVPLSPRDSMRQITRPVLLLHHDRAIRECLHRVEGSHFSVQCYSDWYSLRAAVAVITPAALVVVDPYLDTEIGTGPSLLLRTFLQKFPSATVVAAIRGRPHEYRDVCLLGAWGIADVISGDQDTTPGGIAHRLQSASGLSLRRLLEKSLPLGLPSRARSILFVIADLIAAGGGEREIAQAMSLSRRTLLRWCNSAGLPPPRRLMAWMRILLAAKLLDDPGRTVFSVAFACGYSSDTALRTALQTQLGATPKALRTQGAFNTTLPRFLEELKQAQSRILEPM